MSAIKKLIISLIVIIGILAVVLISVYIVARVNLGVDLFRTVGQLKTLSQPVNEQESFPVAYRSEDLADLKSQTDSQLGDVILKIGSAEELNAKIGTTAANALIGMEQNLGFVYALKAMGGAGSFSFVSFENDGKQINALAF